MIAVLLSSLTFQSVIEFLANLGISDLTIEEKDYYFIRKGIIKILNVVVYSWFSRAIIYHKVPQLKILNKIKFKFFSKRRSKEIKLKFKTILIINKQKQSIKNVVNPSNEAP